MVNTADQARHQLAAALAKGFDAGISRQTNATLNRELRHSAVLILFGALDQVPAAPNGVPVVSTELDVLLT
ncbi:MAG: hypothetical protein Q7J32_15785, partial [Sphingomonadaceae bacterium]|nr:hypothetical protein [Sphingomonadaceae bacterium]